MDLSSIFRLLFRRKWIVLPVALLAIGGLVATLLVAPPTYQVRSTLVLLSPPSAPQDPDTKAIEPEFQNPYVQLGDLSIVVDIVRRVMTSAPIEDRLEADGLVGTYTVAANVDFIRGPIIDIVTDAETGAEAKASNEMVNAVLLEQLDELQVRRGTDERYRITAETVVYPTRSTRLFSSTLRRLIVVGALGVGAILAAAVVADNFAKRREARRGAVKSMAALPNSPGGPTLVPAPATIDGTGVGAAREHTPLVEAWGDGHHGVDPQRPSDGQHSASARLLPGVPSTAGAVSHPSTGQGAAVSNP